MATHSALPADRVSASLTLVGYEMRPEEVTTVLEVEPTATDVSHLPASFHPGGICGGRECGLWSYDTGAVVAASDIGEHLRHLLRLFRPLRSRIEEFNPRPRVFINARCNSICAIGTGPAFSPRIEPDCIAGMAELGAVLTVELIR